MDSPGGTAAPHLQNVVILSLLIRYVVLLSSFLFLQMYKVQGCRASVSDPSILHYSRLGIESLATT